MSWATWTDAFDTDGQWGPGTRRGSTAVLPGRHSISMGQPLPSALEKHDNEKEEPFTWAKGYNEGETPSHDVEEGPTYGPPVAFPHSPARRQFSGSLIGALPEDEEAGEPKSSTRRASFSRASATSARSFAMPESPRRASLALPHSPLNPHPRSRTSSTGILLATPPRRNISISIEEPIMAGRRRSSAHSSGTGSSLGDSRRGSLIPAPPRKSSGLLNVTLPVEDDSPPVDEKINADDLFNILPPTPLPDSAAVMEDIAPPEPALLLAPLMIKSSSQTSGISVRSVSSSGAPSNSSIAPLLRSHSPLSSGVATPMLSMQKTDLSMPSDPEHPGALLEQAFAESSQQRAKQSIGLEQIVYWHEGRADLYKVIEEMMVSVGKGGTVNVEACGPRSLLDKAKDVVQELSDMKAVWEGETRVLYHAETFGW
jgi:hypothetical protein